MAEQIARDPGAFSRLPVDSFRKFDFFSSILKHLCKWICYFKWFQSANKSVCYSLQWTGHDPGYNPAMCPVVSRIASRPNMAVTWIKPLVERNT